MALREMIQKVNSLLLNWADLKLIYKKMVMNTKMKDH